MRNENRFGVYRRGQKNILRNLFCSLWACLFGFLIIFLLCFRSNVGWGWEKMPKTRIFTVLSLYQYLRITASDFGHRLFQCFDILLHIISHCSHLGKQILLICYPCLFCFSVLFVCLERVSVRILESKNGPSVTRSPVRIKYFKKSLSKGVHLCGLM